MEELDYSKISEDEITDAVRYSPEQFAEWRKYHGEKAEQNKNQDDLFLQGFNSDYGRK